MTRAARRATTLLLAVLAAVTFSVALMAPPALAAGEAEGTTAEATGFGAGQWDGMVLAAAIGVLVGGLVFGMSKPGEIHRADAHH